MPNAGWRYEGMASGLTIGFTIGHDVSLANWDSLQNLGRTQTAVAYKSVKPNGATTYAYGYFIMSEVVKQ